MREYSLDMRGSGPCEHGTSRVELTPDGPHYGKRICLQCGKFTGWEPNPKLTMLCAERDRLIDKLLGDGVGEWEQGFLRNIKGKRFLTPKQEQCFRRILNSQL